MAEPLRGWFYQSYRAVRDDQLKQGVNMYAARIVNGVPAIQRDGQSVLSVCDQNWDFASWLCALLNELGHMPELLRTGHGQEWAKPMDGALRRKVQHA